MGPGTGSLDLAGLSETINFCIKFDLNSLISASRAVGADSLDLAGLSETIDSLIGFLSESLISGSRAVGVDFLDLAGLSKTIDSLIRFLSETLISGATSHVSKGSSCLAKPWLALSSSAKSFPPKKEKQNPELICKSDGFA